MRGSVDCQSGPARLIVGDVATAETSAAPAESGAAVVLETRRGARRIEVAIRYQAVQELREMLTRPEPVMGGLLRGRWTGDAIVLEHAAAAAAGDAIGVFRAQPGGWTALTPADRKKLKAAGLERGVLLVVRTLAQRPWSATLFAVEEEGAGVEGPLAELPWDEYLLRNGWLMDLAPPAPPQPHPALAARPGRWRGWTAGAALLLLAGAGGAASYRWLPAVWNQAPAEATAEPPAAAPAVPGLALKVARVAQDLDVSWNRGSEAVRQARAATLTVRSGAATRVIEMRPEQLREGRVLFRPLAGVDTDVRLEVLDAGGRAEAEAVAVLGFDTAPAVTLPAQAPRAPAAAAPANGARKPAPRLPEAPAPAADRGEAVPIRRATPDLTPEVMNEMRAAGGKVTVSVLVSIDAAGTVNNAKVVASSGEPNPSGPYIRLASLNAARQWRFRPATADGKNVASQMTLLFSF